MREQPGDDQAEPHAAQAEHRVLLVQPADRVEQRWSWPASSPRASASATFDRQLGEVGQELVQRRVEQPDRHRQAVHRLEDPDEVVALQRLAAPPAPPALASSLSARISRSTSWPGGRRGTCARCGTGRCPRRRSAGPARSPPGVGVGPHLAGASSSACVISRCTAATSSSASSAGIERPRSTAPPATA